MNTRSTSEVINQDRRRLLGLAAAGIAASAANLLPSQLAAAPAGDAIRPFRVDIPEAQLVDLRRRIAATRWPDQETVSDRSQGNQLGKLQEIVRHWGTDYDWRKVEARLNALPMFMTEIDGVDIHFIHVRSRHENALPLIVTHGWPGSVIEQLKIIDPLTNPTAHGANASDAFHLVIPSMPGYGFSGKPKDKGWNPDRIARAWAELMRRLGYTRYVAQGGDWGSPVSSAMARQAVAGLLGIHINLPATVPSDVAAVLASGGPAPAGLSDKERAAFNALDTFYKKYRAYGAIMGTRPQTIGYALTDSPVGLAAWIFDYNNGEPARRLDRDDVLDNITLYWLTNTATSARACTGKPPAKASFFRPRRRPARFRFRSRSRCFRMRSIEPRRPGRGARTATSSTSTRLDKGGHFAAWEQPELFAAELRAAFRSLRPAH